MADVSQIKLPNGSVYDLIDEKSGYITAEYIENKTDYEIPVSRVGEIVVGETAIGTDSTNFPTSKAVVDYVDERVVQEIAAIDFDSGITGIQANGTSLPINNGVVNIPAIGPGQSVGLMTDRWMQQIWNGLHSIPTSTSQLTNDSGFITASDIPTQNISWANYRLNTIGTAWDLYPLGDNATSGSSNTFKISTGFHLHEVGGTTVSSVLHIGDISSKRIGGIRLYDTQYSGTFQLGNSLTTSNLTNNRIWNLPDKTGTVALTSDIPTVPTNISSFTNDSGYLTASDIASVMTYKGTKANYAALPSTGNTTGDVWHLTDTGAEWAWDGSAWQELGTAIDLSGYATKATTLAGYGITDAKIQDGVITLGNNTMTPLTSISLKPNGSGFIIQNSKGNYTNVSIPVKTSDLTNDSGFLTSYTETDPTVPSWAKQSSKPTYTAAEVGALPDSTVIPSKTSDLTNDSGFITSDSDEKVKQTPIGDSDSTIYGLIVAYNNGGTETTDFVRSTNKIYINNSTPSIIIGKSTDTQRLAIRSDRINFIYNSGNHQGHLKASSITGNDKTWTLPDKTGTVALTSDIPDISSFLTSETDPVFSASAAAGITSTDISNWNGKSSTDEKVKQESLNGASSDRNILTTSSYQTTGTITNSVQYTRYIYLDDFSPYITIVNKTDSSKYTRLRNNGFSISTGTYQITITAAEQTTSHQITLPNKTGTVALTSDIPSVYSSTNTGGYLTMATLPIYDGTVV